MSLTFFIARTDCILNYNRYEKTFACRGMIDDKALWNSIQEKRLWLLRMQRIKMDQSVAIHREDQEQGRYMGILYT